MATSNTRKELGSQVRHVAVSWFQADFAPEGWEANLTGVMAAEATSPG
jgi:hypothetical protein